MVASVNKRLATAIILTVALSAVCETADFSKNETVGRYQLVSFDFHHVEIPYVICLWVLLASVAKIGKSYSIYIIYKLMQHMYNIAESIILQDEDARKFQLKKNNLIFVWLLKLKLNVEK